MKKKGYSVASFSSDIEQGDRERIMLDFKSRKLNMLVGTDILARGIDVDGIELVVNYDLPSDADDYVHRIGRTARAERDGTAITFVEPRDMRKFSRIYEMVDKRIALETVPSEIGEAIEFRLDEKRGSSNGKSSPTNKRRFNGPKSNRSQNKKRPPRNDGRANS